MTYRVNLKKITTKLSILGVLVCLVSINASAAIYEMTFTGTFSPGDVSDSYPSNAHFSPLVGATHNAQGGFWQQGQLASTGVKNVAELGSSGVLENELAFDKSQGTTGDFIQTGSLFGLVFGPKTTAPIQFEITEDKPYVSFVSMVAPSPDWFVGISKVLLFENEIWAETLTMGLPPLDAGTDNGTTFNAFNSATNPKQPINFPFFSPFNGNNIASITFTLIEGSIVPPEPEPVIVVPAITTLILE